MQFLLINYVSGSALFCRFENISGSILGNFRTLRICFIEGQSVLSPDSTIKQYPVGSAKGLYINSNKDIKFVPANIAAIFPNLISLQIYKCAITAIGDQFKGLLSLDQLYLGFNDIETIAEDAFVDNANIEELNMSENKLKHLSAGLFRSLIKLKSLHLHNNQINSIESGAFENLNNLNDLKLSGNPCINKDYRSGSDVSNLKIDLETMCIEDTITENPNGDATLTTISENLNAEN